MGLIRRWLFASLLLICSITVRGAESAEDRAFKAGEQSFAGGFWARAEAEFAQFAANYRQSPRVPKALLYQAQAQLKQRKFEQAIALLAAHLGEADKLADEYLYWQGESHFANNNNAAAADTFGKLAAGFPASARRLEASVREATARAKLAEWQRVTELLQNPDGAFRQAAKPDSEFFARGLLLLAEAELAQKHPAAVEPALQPLAGIKLAPDLDWQRRYLICRAQFGAGKTDDALNCSTDLVSLAEATSRRDFLAEAVAFRGGVLERLGRLDEAAAAYQRNLATNMPVAQQSQAVVKLAELALLRNQLTEAAQLVEKLLGQFSQTIDTNVALLTLGELQLRQLISGVETNRGPGAVTTTNLWQTALANFDRVITVSSNAILAGKAQLGRGWCFWLSNNLPESVTAFSAATNLPASEDLVVAYFKVGDGLFAQKDCTNALANYRRALEAAVDFPRVKETLTPQALYQMLRAGLCVKDLASAEDSLRKILNAYPSSAVADRSVLLVGQGYGDAEKPVEARARFQEFLQLFPASLLRPEVELAMAQTHEQESHWPEAVGAYAAWLEHFPTNRLLRPQAEFYHALATFRAGNETNALALLTNFVARFATNDLAPLAQRWVADYYWNQGEFLAAETNYRLLFQNWAHSGLAFQARMRAGQAAVGRQDYSPAIDYFKLLTSDTNCPPGLQVEAMFAYGGALMFRNSGETNDPSADLKLAIRVFGTVRDKYPNAEPAARAWGEIGECYLQLRPQDPRNYESASNAFQQVVTSTNANVAARSQAKFGLALVTEKYAEAKSGPERTALLKLARDHYLDVFYYEKILRDGEKPDWYWVKKGGLEAARIIESAAESPEEWAQARELYENLKKLLPPLQASLEKRIDKVKEHLPP